MNEVIVASKLAELARKARPNPGLLDYNPKSAKAVWIRNQRVDDRAPEVAKIAAILASDPEFARWDNVQIRSSPYSGCRIRLIDFAHWALAQAKIRSAKDVARQLFQFVHENAVTMSEVMVLWGVHPRKPIVLPNGFRLVPLDLLQPSIPWDEFFGIFDVLHAEGNIVLRPRAALVYEFRHEPIRTPIGFSRSDESKHPLMQEIISVLPLATFTPVCEIAHWFQCDVVTPIIGGVRGWGGQGIEHAFQFERSKRDFDASDMADIVMKYLGLQKHLRETLQVSLFHLNRAMREYDKEAAIDLGISLESFLTSDLTGDAPIAYRLRQRAAALLGGSGHRKKSVYNRVKQLYELRSRAVHGSPLPSHVTIVEGRKIDTNIFLRRSGWLVMRLLRCVLDRGGIPDWEALIMGW